MKQFGGFLKEARQKSIDPKSKIGLSQERLGQLLGAELDREAFSSSVISDWERGVRGIYDDDRLILIGLLKVLHQNGGIDTPVTANNLLEAGNYRSLNSVERLLVFPENSIESFVVSPTNQLTTDQKIVRFLLRKVFRVSGEYLSKLSTEIEITPSPVWPRVAMGLFQIFLQQLTTSRVLNALLWLILWLFSQALIAPSLFWPFANEDRVNWAITLYSGGALILPLLIAVLVNTRNDDFWQERALSSSPITRLYTYQGAFVGFHVGYFITFLLNLIFYFLKFDILEFGRFVLVAVPLIFGYLGARTVPRNLWNAYGRLSLSDGVIFFVFLILGPIWGWFLSQYYSLLFANPKPVILVLVLPVFIVLVLRLVATKSNFDKPKDKNHQI